MHTAIPAGPRTREPLITMCTRACECGMRRAADSRGWIAELDCGGGEGDGAATAVARHAEGIGHDNRTHAGGRAGGRATEHRVRAHTCVEREHEHPSEGAPRGRQRQRARHRQRLDSERAASDRRRRPRARSKPC
eukprot:5557611-Prymnesium_polylepis.1